MRAHASISTLRTYHGRARSMVDCMWCYCNYNEGGEYRAGSGGDYVVVVTILMDKERGGAACRRSYLGRVKLSCHSVVSGHHIFKRYRHNRRSQKMVQQSVAISTLPQTSS